MNLESLKSSLWGAAVLLRGKINATGYVDLRATFKGDAWFARFFAAKHQEHATIL